MINNVDKFLKNSISDGDLLQALALLIATRVYISPFENEKMLQLLFKMTKEGLSNIESKKSKIGNS